MVMGVKEGTTMEQRRRPWTEDRIGEDILLTVEYLT
jgi:hypothetical protein